MTWVEMFVRVAAFTGAALMVASAIAAVCAAWWYVLGRVRKCLYETYLLADMKLWMRRHNKEPRHD